MDSLKNGRILKFLISGGSAALIEYVIFIIGVGLFPGSLSRNLFHILGFIAGLCVSFLANKYWVFSDGELSNSTSQLIKFLSLALFNLLFSAIILNISVLFMAEFLAKVITMAMIAVWNFVIMKKFIFKK